MALVGWINRGIKWTWRHFLPPELLGGVLGSHVPACFIMSNSLQLHGLQLPLQQPSSSVHWNFPGKNAGVGCHFLLQEIFLTQGSKPRLLHWQADSLSLSHLGAMTRIQRKGQHFGHFSALHIGFTWLTIRVFIKTHHLFPRNVLALPKIIFILFQKIFHVF